MEKVKILKDIYVEQTDLQYRTGEVVEVPKYLADRHVKTGFMEIIKPEKIKLEKSKTI